MNSKKLFKQKMAHAGYMSPTQQVQLFTGGLPEAIKLDVELHAPQDLQSAMALVRGYERSVMATAAAANKSSITVSQHIAVINRGRPYTDITDSGHAPSGVQVVLPSHTNRDGRAQTLWRPYSEINPTRHHGPLKDHALAMFGDEPSLALVGLFFLPWLFDRLEFYCTCGPIEFS